MNFAIKPPSLRKPPTQSTKEEVPQLGCCFPLFSNTQTKRPQSDTTLQRYSQPKPKGQKKIDLLVAKNRLSQAKFQRNPEASSSNQNQKNQSQLKTIQNTTNFTSLMSKVTTQKNSLKNSTVKLSLENKAKKTQDTSKNQKQTFSHNNNKVIHKSSPQQHLKVQITNIQYLSEISMIEQECVSHGSTTLNALNFLNHFPYSQSKGYEMTLTPVRYMIDAVNQKRRDEIKQTSNPLQRLIQKKKGANVEVQKAKLCL